MSDSNKTPEKKGLSRRGALGLGAAALVAAGGGAAYYVLSQDDAIETATAANSGSMDVDPQTDRIMGEMNAPVTLVEYSSLTCPHCANFHQMTLPDLKEKYIETGKVRYVIRQFPLDRVAFAAAAIARCADPGKYFPFVEALYKNQSTWALAEGDPGPRLFNMAKQAGFTKESYNACLGNQEVIDHIQEVRRRGNEVHGVNSTPTLFVNGKMVEGTNSLEDIEKAMEPYLEG